MCLPQFKQCSWQQQRYFAEAAVAPKFDWDSLEGSVASEEGKRELASLRSTWIDVQQKFDSMTQVYSLCSLIIFAAALYLTLSKHSAIGSAVQSSGEIDWKSYEKEVDPQVLKLFKDSFACKQSQHPFWLQVACLPCCLPLNHLKVVPVQPWTFPCMMPVN